MFESRVLVALILFSFLLEVSSFGCPMGGGGGGGGCCMMSCGGCGRKKRSLIEPTLRTEKDSPCPQASWKEVIEEHLGSDAQTSKYSVQAGLFKNFETKFLVTCAETENKHHLQFVASGEAYCSAGNDKVWCAAVLLQI